MGDSQSEVLRALHDEHAPALWRYAVWLCGDCQLAEDIVQETLLRAWRRPVDLGREGASARAWLFTVARNLVIDEFRSAHARHELAAATVPDRISADHTDSVLDAWLVSDALAQLSPEHRVVVVHAYYRCRRMNVDDTNGILPTATSARPRWPSSPECRGCSHRCLPQRPRPCWSRLRWMCRTCCRGWLATWPGVADARGAW